jgi:hypothetical protein
MAVEKYGFCPTRRGLFKMPAKSIIFDFSLFPCPIVNSLSIVEGKPQQEKDEYQHFWKEDAIKQVSPNFHSFDLLIKYGDKKLDSRFTTYKGFADNSGVTHRVELIYNLTTIWADKVYVNASHTEAVLEGKVLIVNNLYRREFEKAITIFNRGKVKIKFAN